MKTNRIIGPLPKAQEINSEGNSYDGQTAVNHFLEKTQEQITKELTTRLRWYFYEDFIWMGCRALCFYFPVVAHYVTTAEAKVDYQVVENSSGVIERCLRFDCAGIRESFPAIVRFAEYIVTHFGDYDYDLEDEDLRRRLGTIKRQCAEPGAALTGGALEPQRNSAAPEGSRSAS